MVYSKVFIVRVNMYLIEAPYIGFFIGGGGAGGLYLIFFSLNINLCIVSSLPVCPDWSSEALGRVT